MSSVKRSIAIDAFRCIAMNNYLIDAELPYPMAGPRPVINVVDDLASVEVVSGSGLLRLQYHNDSRITVKLDAQDARASFEISSWESINDIFNAISDCVPYTPLFNDAFQGGDGVLGGFMDAVGKVLGALAVRGITQGHARKHLCDGAVVCREAYFTQDLHKFILDAVAFPDGSVDFHAFTDADIRVDYREEFMLDRGERVHDEFLRFMCAFSRTLEAALEIFRA